MIGLRCCSVVYPTGAHATQSALTYTVTTRARWRSLLHRLLSVIRFCITVPSLKIRNTSGCTDRYRRDVLWRFTICSHVHIIAGVGFALALINRQRVQIFAWLAVFFFVGLKGRRTTLSVASLVVLAICRYSLDHDNSSFCRFLFTGLTVATSPFQSNILRSRSAARGMASISWL